MKILYVLKTNTGAAWAYKHAEWLYNYRDIEFSVVMPDDSTGYALKYKALGIKVIPYDFSLPITKPWQILKKKRRLAEIINEEKPDIIHCHFVTNILLLRLCAKDIRIPRIFQVPGPLHLENPIIRKIEIGLSNENDYWIGACEKTCHYYIDAGISRDRVYLGYYGDYIDKIHNTECDDIIRSTYGIKDDETIIATVSYFYKPKYHMLQFRGLKGHEDFIDAFSIVHNKNPKTRAVIVGGPWGNSQKYMDKVVKYAKKKCGDSIIFTGYRNDVLKIYRNFDMVVHPSHSENLGGALESLSLSVPTVTTDIGGFPDIVIDGETGYTAPAKNPEKLAEAILKMLSDKKKANELAGRGYALVKEKCDISVTAAGIYDFYNKVLGE